MAVKPVDKEVEDLVACRGGRFALAIDEVNSDHAVGIGNVSGEERRCDHDSLQRRGVAADEGVTQGSRVGIEAALVQTLSPSNR